MDGLVIHIGWEYFLAIMGGLIAIAYFTGARFAALETSIKWIIETINELKIAADNEHTPTFGSESPINLNELGQTWLLESGIKEYVDLHKDEFMDFCGEKKETNPYEVQKHIFKTFDTLELEPKFEEKLKQFAFSKGTSMNILRRVAAIYFRNICLHEFHMNADEIERHDPKKAGDAQFAS